MSNKPEWMRKVIGKTVFDVFNPAWNDDVTVFEFESGRLTHSYGAGQIYSEQTADSSYSEWTWEDKK